MRVYLNPETLQAVIWGVRSKFVSFSNNSLSRSFARPTWRNPLRCQDGSRKSNNQSSSGTPRLLMTTSVLTDDACCSKRRDECTERMNWPGRQNVKNTEGGEKLWAESPIVLTLAKVLRIFAATALTNQISEVTRIKL